MDGRHYNSMSMDINVMITMQCIMCNIQFEDDV